MEESTAERKAREKAEKDKVKFAGTVINKISAPKIALEAVQQDPKFSMIPEMISKPLKESLEKLTSIEQAAANVVKAKGAGKCKIPVNDIKDVQPLVKEARRNQQVCEQMLATLNKFDG